MIRLMHRERTHPKRIPETVREYLRKRFMMPGAYIEGFRCIETSRLVDGKMANWIRVYEPSLARRKGLAIRDDLDLDQHPEVVLFEGYVTMEGRIYLADRRQPRSEYRAKGCC